MLKIEYLNEESEVYDITVSSNHNFYANDILVHNCAEIDLPTRPMASKKKYNQNVPNINLAAFLEKLYEEDAKITRVLSQTNDSTEFEIEEDDSRIALCTLSAINWGNIKQPSDFEKPCMLAVRALDALLDYQTYPVRAAQKATMEHRPLGIGIINFAYWLAKNDLKYSDGSALAKVDEYAEAWSYYLIKASVDLAKEKGPCGKVDDTKYALGIMPNDTRKRDVDELVAYTERMPWAQLREEAKKYGIRNGTLMALMPAECQHWSNKLNLADGSNLDFHQLLETQNIDWNEIESSGTPQRYTFDKPVKINTQNGIKEAYEFYYNGYEEIYEIEFNDSQIYKFTGNHLLLVNRNGIDLWVRVDQLQEEDKVISVNV